MKTLFIIICSFILSSNLLFAQNAQFITAGSIEYNKSVNTHPVLKRMMAMYPAAAANQMQPMMDQYKNTKPQFKILKSTLSFSTDQTLFTPVVDNSPPDLISSQPIISQINTVYTDLATGSSVNNKDLLGEKILVRDSTRKINWKITTETKEIAGYTCRRANAIIMDSVYVVAFYTDQILAKGGPESFTGLPGMILQVALPHDNISWIATKVIPASVPPAELKAPAPSKAKIMTSKDLRSLIETKYKNMMTPEMMSYIYKSLLL